MSLITIAQSEDVQEGRALLTRCGLPQAGLSNGLAVAPAIRASVEWTSDCPVSAHVMVLNMRTA
jgi:hypothetical protein